MYTTGHPGVRDKTQDSTFHSTDTVKSDGIISIYVTIDKVYIGYKGTKEVIVREDGWILPQIQERVHRRGSIVPGIPVSVSGAASLSNHIVINSGRACGPSNSSNCLNGY